MLLGLKQVYRLPLRALQGFAQSLCKFAFADLPVPNYTTLCCRGQELNMVLPALRSGKPLHLVVDSAGLKLYGEGEWKVRKHGHSKRRTRRKVHLAMDANTDQVCVALMTHRDLVEILMYRLKTLTAHSLWEHCTGPQATDVSIRVGVLNRMTTLARPQCVPIA
ncbi:hypothetical protein LMG28727_00840 [Paraburkholderia kirstenboschensis]|nr:hypothetical protein LMG28727_00840 [Paraburkholderia kirstenboschensis]